MQYLEEVNINGSLNMVSSTEIGTLAFKDLSYFRILAGTFKEENRRF